MKFDNHSSVIIMTRMIFAGELGHFHNHCFVIWNNVDCLSFQIRSKIFQRSYNCKKVKLQMTCCTLSRAEKKTLLAQAIKVKTLPLYSWVRLQNVSILHLRQEWILHQSPQNVVLVTLTTFAWVFAVVKGANISVNKISVKSRDTKNMPNLNLFHLRLRFAFANLCKTASTYFKCEGFERKFLSSSARGMDK